MNRKCLILAAIAATVLLCHAAPGFADLTPLLGSAENFAVLGGSTVTNTGATKITGDLGVSPGSAVTGFPPGLVSGGTIHAGDAAAAAAQGAFTLAYNGLANMSVPTGNNLTALGDLGGLTLNPGVYKFDSSAGLTGTLTLDAQGNNDVYWVFQIGSALTTAGSSSVNVINLGTNGGKDDGVFWQVGSSATLGTNSTFEGNILAATSITMTTGAIIPNGRAWAQSGSVTLDTNTISTVCPNGGPGYSGGLVYDTESQTVVSAPAAVPIVDSSILGGLGLGVASLCGYVRRRVRR